MTRFAAANRMGRAVNAIIEKLEGRALMSATPTVVANSPVLVFNSVAQGNTGASASKVDLLTLTDTGSAPLSLGSFSIVDDPTSPTHDASSFSIVSVTPTAIAAGATASVSVQYTASIVGVQSAFLQIPTNDPSNPLLSIPLHGIGTAGTGGGYEPSLAEILREYNIPTIVGDGPNDSNAFASTYYPSTPDASSEQVSMQRLMKAGTGPVTITLLASFAVNNNPASRFGYYTPGSPTDRTELFSIGQADSQTVNPTALGATSFDPGSNTFGLYGNFPTFTDSGHQRISYSENALNTWDSKVPQKVRFFPLRDAAGNIVPNAFIFAMEDNNIPFGAIQPYDSNDIVGIIRNVMPATGATNAPVLGLENLTAVPATNQLVFNRIQNLNPNPVNPSGFVDQVHDTNTLRIHNTGDKPLQINALVLSDSVNWMIVNPPAAGTTVAPGGFLDLTIKFIAQKVPTNPYNETNDSATGNGLQPLQAGGVYTGTLAIQTNDPANPQRIVKLAGYWQNTSENENEPGLQTITNLVMGYTTTIAGVQKIQYGNYGTQAVYYGEEVVSGTWNSADPTLPVSVTQIASYHNQTDASTGKLTASSFGYTKPGTSTTTWLFTDQTGAGQTLLPTIKGSTTKIASGSFNPTGSFGLNLDGELSEDALNTGNTSLGRSGHAVRFFPVRGADGNIVPNTYLVVMDYGGGTYDNADFQDNMFLVTNIRPSAKPATPTDLQVFNDGNTVSFQWAPVVDPTLQGYNVYRSSSPNGPWVKLNTKAFADTSFVDQAPAAGTNYYRVVALDVAEGVAATASIVPIMAAPVNDVLTSVDVNTGLTGTTNVITSGKDYTLTGAGADIGGTTADSYRYAYESVTGDFDVQVQVNSLSAVQSGTRAGLMIRTSNDPGAPMLFVGPTATDGYRFNYRTTQGGAGTYIKYGSISYPNVWVRMTRVGNVFTGYYSTDGINWTKMQSLTLTVGTTLDLGLAVCSHTTTQTATAQFRSFNLTQAAANPGNPVITNPGDPTPIDPGKPGPTESNPVSPTSPTSPTLPGGGGTTPTTPVIVLTPAQQVAADRVAINLAIKIRAAKLKAARALVTADNRAATAAMRALNNAKKGHKTPDASLVSEVATEKSLLASAKASLAQLLKSDFTGITLARKALTAAMKAMALAKRK